MALIIKINSKARKGAILPRITEGSKKKLYLFAMAFPLFAMVIVFSYFPLWGWVMAFVKYTPGVSIFSSPFVGFKYFKDLFEIGGNFPLVFRNTVVLGILGQLGTPLALTLAILLNECRSSRFKRLVQTATSLPNFISMIVIYSVFFRFLSVDDGLINLLLVKLGIINTPIDFLASANLVWPLQTFISIWKSTGWTAIIFISAIVGIDQELYEAAVVDGANRFQEIIHITIPGIMSTFVIMMILSIGYLLSSGFEQYYLFFNGMVASKIEVIDTYVYRIGVANMNYSYATAVGISKTFISVVLLMGANWMSKKVTDRSVF